MTCYFRHLQDAFDEAGIAVTKENKRQLDRAVHAIVGVDYKNCSAAWKEVKRRMAEDREGFVSRLKESLARTHME